jgi:hypothetical protein
MLQLTKLQEKVLIECIGKKYTRSELAELLGKVTNEKSRKGIRPSGDLKGDITKLVNQNFLIDKKETNSNLGSRSKYLLTNPDLISIFIGYIQKNYDSDKYVIQKGSTRKIITNYKKVIDYNNLILFFSLKEVGNLIKIYYDYFNNILNTKKSLVDIYLYIIEIFLVRNYLMIFYFNKNSINLINSDIKFFLIKYNFIKKKIAQNDNLLTNYNAFYDEVNTLYNFSKKCPFDFYTSELYDFSRLEIRNTNHSNIYNSIYIKPISDKIQKLYMKLDNSSNQLKIKTIMSEINILSLKIENFKKNKPNLYFYKNLDIKKELPRYSNKVSLFVYLLFKDNENRTKEIRDLIIALFDPGFFRTISMDLLDKND